MNENKIPISVIIVTHRCDERLKAAVQSAQFAEEVIIVENKIKLDKKLLASCDYKSFQFDEEQTDFAAMRNFAIRKATQGWVFFLDSDEVITKDSIEEINKIITKSDHNAVFIKRIDFFLGKQMKHGEVGNVWIIRMGKRSVIKFVGAVHEIAKYSGTLMYSKIVVHHFSHQSVSDYFNKISWYALLDAEQRSKSSESFNWLELFFYPAGKFMQNYIIKQGFRDGYRGLIYAIMMSCHSMFVRVFQFELEKTRSPFNAQNN